jgi:ABC-type uncharacterized transport system permease subunit
VSLLSDRQFFFLAVILYGVSSLYAVFLWRQGFRNDNRVTYLLLLGAFAFHTLAMFSRGVSMARCPVHNLYEVITFISWTIVAFYLVIGFWARLRFLGAFASPIMLAMGVLAIMPGMDPPYSGTTEFRSDWASIHAALILLSLGSFGLSSVAGAMYLTHEHNLKFHKLQAIFSRLPPIERLEMIINRFLLGGFILLTAGLSLSPLLTQQRFGVYFRSDPILLYSIFIWFLYLGLLGMRWQLGQGGRRIAWGAIGSFAFILLTFWGFILLSPSHGH